MEKIYSTVSDPALCDMSVKIGTKTYWMHKCVILAACPKLHNAITMKKNNETALDDLTVQGFDAFLKYIYTGIAPSEQKKAVFGDFVETCAAFEVHFVDKENNNCDPDTRILGSIGNPSDEVVIEVFTVEDNTQNTNNDSASMVTVDTGDNGMDFNTAASLHVTNDSDNTQSMHYADLVDISPLFSVSNRTVRDSTEPLPKKSKPTEPPKISIATKRSYAEPVGLDLREDTCENSFVCPTCGRTFSELRKLEIHSATHKITKFPCFICYKIYSSHPSRAAHIKEQHSKSMDPLDFMCSTCGLAHQDEKSLRAHVLSGCNTSSYLCLKCGQSYKRHMAFLPHIKKCKGMTRYQCKHCGKSFKGIASASNHLQFTHQTYPPKSEDLVKVLART